MSRVIYIEVHGRNAVSAVLYRAEVFEDHILVEGLPTLGGTYELWGDFNDDGEDVVRYARLASLCVICGRPVDSLEAQARRNGLPSDEYVNHPAHSECQDRFSNDLEFAAAANSKPAHLVFVDA